MFSMQMKALGIRFLVGVICDDTRVVVIELESLDMRSQKRILDDGAEKLKVSLPMHLLAFSGRLICTKELG